MKARGLPDGGARAFWPQRATLRALRRAAQGCGGCPLCRDATRTVFGEGPRRAHLMLVGEQPGDEEDRAGHPFVGPAGRLLDQALLAAGVKRDETYITNVVKHFKWQLRGKRRVHLRPELREIEACLPWLEQELRAVKPAGLVCLGATAAQTLLGRSFRVTTQRGRRVESQWAPYVVATVHPSSILRIPDRERRQQALELFIADLRYSASLLESGG